MYNNRATENERNQIINCVKFIFFIHTHKTPYRHCIPKIIITVYITSNDIILCIMLSSMALLFAYCDIGIINYYSVYYTITIYIMKPFIIMTNEFHERLNQIYI